MMLKHKNAMGTFSELFQIESALEQLKLGGIVVSNVSVIVPQPDSDDPQLEKLTEPIVQSESEFINDRPTQVAVKAGAVGSVVGGVVAGLTTLAFPAFSGAVVLVGIATGAFYGAVSGGVLGGEEGLEISATQAQLYDDRLAQGNYLLIVKGSDDEIDRAELILKTANIQDWMVLNTL
jgi:outer membrane lipoprotein SlyB